MAKSVSAGCSDPVAAKHDQIISPPLPSIKSIKNKFCKMLRVVVILRVFKENIYVFFNMVY